MIIPFVRCHSLAKDPQRMTERAAGYDVVAVSVEVDREANCVIYSTGLSVALPEGTYIDLRPRSSIYKTQWILANSCGVIDADYRGEVKVIFTPLDPNTDVRDTDLHPYKIGERIAQWILCKHEAASYEEVKELSTTERGKGGLGSTNKKGSKTNEKSTK